MNRTKVVKALLHLVKYFYRISVDPTIADLKTFMFIQKLNTALHMSEISKKLIDQSNKKVKEYYPGPLES